MNLKFLPSPPLQSHSFAKEWADFFYRRKLIENKSIVSHVAMDEPYLRHSMEETGDTVHPHEVGIWHLKEEELLLLDFCEIFRVFLRRG